MKNGKYVVAKYDLNDYAYKIDKEQGYITIERTINVKAWAEDVVSRFSPCYQYWGLDSGIIVAKEKGINRSRKLRVGVAYCNLGVDDFDRAIGFAIAICRAEGIKIPREIFASQDAR